MRRVKTPKPESRIFDSSLRAKRLITEWRGNDQSIVFTNGCFDLLHKGHIDYLHACACIGDRLVVGLNTDESVRNIKGNDRPINNQESRAIVLASLGFVDAVIFFCESTPMALIKNVNPDVIIKGADYHKSEMIGADYVQSMGGRVMTIPLTKGYSSTKILKSIKRSK